MTNYELGDNPVGLRRGRLTMAANLGAEPVALQLRTADSSAPITGLWAQLGTGYVGMFNRAVADLPKQVTITAARADGSPFPAAPPLQVTVGVGNDAVLWSASGLGGMPIADIVTLTVADEWLSFARPADDVGKAPDLPPGAARMAAAARRALGVASVPDAQRAHVVVVVDPSGSMKTNRARACLRDAADALVGIHAVLGGTGKRLEWHLATAPPRRFETAEALLTALEDSAYSLGRTLDLPGVVTTMGGELTVVYLVSDDVPGRLGEFTDVDMQARHLVVVANPASAPSAVGPVDVTVWPMDSVDDARLPALAKDLLRGCFDANTACGRAVSV